MLSGLHAGGKAGRWWEHRPAEGRTLSAEITAGCSEGGVVVERSARQSRSSVGLAVKSVFFPLCVVDHLSQVSMILDAIHLAESKSKANKLLKATHMCQPQSRLAIRHSAAPSHRPIPACGHSGCGTTGCGPRPWMPLPVLGSLCENPCLPRPGYLPPLAVVTSGVRQARDRPCRSGFQPVRPRLIARPAMCDVLSCCVLP